MATFSIDQVRGHLATAQYKSKDKLREKPFFYFAESSNFHPPYKNVRISLRRIAPHMELGFKCARCARVGSTYHLEFSPSSGAYHLDLYTEDDFLMTIDHVHPRAKGGKDTLSNYQMMCQPCNTRKGDKE
jgi:5-methylcytosine-specific restriction endonuclease McrA